MFYICEAQQSPAADEKAVKGGGCWTLLETDLRFLEKGCFWWLGVGGYVLPNCVGK